MRQRSVHIHQTTRCYARRSKCSFQGVFNAVNTSDIIGEEDLTGWIKLHNGDSADISAQFHSPATLPETNPRYISC
jgi:hypothetical protein